MPTTRGPFGSTDSCVFERLARDAVEPFLRSRGIEVREDVRRKAGEGESQQLLALLASGSKANIRVRLCWRRDERNYRREPMLCSFV